MRKNPLQKLPLSTSERSWMQEAERGGTIRNDVQRKCSREGGDRKTVAPEDRGWGQERKTIYNQIIWEVRRRVKLSISVEDSH